MSCNIRMSTIEPPITYVYGVLFICGSVVAIIGNIIALIVVWMVSYRSRSNTILGSLALSDALVGLIVFPITAYQLLNHTELSNCSVDNVRVYSAVLLTGSSVLILGVVAFDRYLLMTKMALYDKRPIKYSIVVMITLAWLIPGLSPFLRLVNSTVYLIANTTIFISPFFILFTSYLFIAKLVREQEKKLKQLTLQSLKDIPQYANDQKEQQTEQSFHEMDHQQQMSSTNSTATVYVTITSNINISHSSKPELRITVKKQKGHIKVAKAVILLMCAYFFCIIPSIIWMILRLIDRAYPFISIEALQNLYLFSMVTLAYNSCINPLIYFFKNPEMRKGFNKLFKITTKISNHKTRHFTSADKNSTSNF